MMLSAISLKHYAIYTLTVFVLLNNLRVAKYIQDKATIQHWSTLQHFWYFQIFCFLLHICNIPNNIFCKMEVRRTKLNSPTFYPNCKIILSRFIERHLEKAGWTSTHHHCTHLAQIIAQTRMKALQKNLWFVLLSLTGKRDRIDT
jgi:hypothetical protein